jgi:aminopeptidase YwaD
MASTKVLADTEDKQEMLNEISADNIMEHIDVLSPGDDARVTGSDGERAAAEYIEGLFMDEFKLDEVEKPTFDAVVFYDYGAKFAVNTPGDLQLSGKGALNMEFTASGTVSAPLVYSGIGGTDDFAGIDVTGKIALIRRGEYTFGEKVRNAAAAGAAGAIIFNNIMEEGFIMATLGEPANIPAIEIHPEDGEKLSALLQNGTEISATMTASGKIENVVSQNVIGTLYAEENKNNTPTIVIGAHYDCVNTPGANDNASGTATMLELARVLSKYEHNANIKFIAFGAEEVGLVGAYDFVEGLDKNERQKIAAMINMDMVGVGDKVGIFTIGDKASSVMADLAETYIQKNNLDYLAPDIEDRSDHAAFAENGIPAVYFTYEVDPNYHTDNDIIDYVEGENVGNIAKIVAEMTYDMAEAPRLQSTQGFNGIVNQYRHINPNKLQK